MCESGKRVIAIMTGNSNSGSSCIDELLSGRYAEAVRESAGNIVVRGVFRSEEKAAPLVQRYGSALEAVVGVDARDIPAMKERAFAGATAALIVTPVDYKSGFKDDAALTANMINAAVDSGVKYVVLVASWTVCDMKSMSIISSRFKPSEELLERLGRERGLKWTVLRGGCFMENIFMNLDAIKKESVLKLTKSKAPIVDTRDIGKSAAACLMAKNCNEHHGKYYEMNGPEVLSSQQMAEIMSKALGRQIKYYEIPLEKAVTFGIPEAVAQIFRWMADEKNTVPFTQDVKNLTGQNGTFEQFCINHKEMMKAD